MAERRSVYNQVTELTNRIKSQARQGWPGRPGRRRHPCALCFRLV